MCVPRNFLTPHEDCLKSFGIKTFLRIHRCLKYSELDKKFAEPLSRAFSRSICQQHIFFTQLWYILEEIKNIWDENGIILAWVKIQLVSGDETNFSPV